MRGVVDLAAGELRGVRLLCRLSSHGREYPHAVMVAARKLYEGKPVFLGHVQAGQRRTDRPLGWIKWPCVQGAGMYTRVVLNEHNPRTADFVRRAILNPQGLGLSHNAGGLVEESADGSHRMVISIDMVESVDLAEGAASTGRLFDGVPELIGEDSTMARRWLRETNLSLFGERHSRLREADEDDDEENNGGMDVDGADDEPDDEEDDEAQGLADRLVELVRQLAVKGQPASHTDVELLKEVIAYLAPAGTTVEESKHFTESLHRLQDDKKLKAGTLRRLREHRFGPKRIAVKDGSSFAAALREASR